MTYEEFLDILEELEFDLDTASEGLDIEVSKIKSWKNLDEIPKIAEDWIKKEKVELADLNNNEDSEVIDEDLKEEDQIENELTDDLQDIDSEVNEEELN
tara:strand:+ start:317 stop:613 length:297 start_codon:yes stop_codon:yes gene_type:complete